MGVTDAVGPGATEDAVADGNGGRRASDERADGTPSGLHPWRSIVFAPIGDGRRRRRGSDAVRLVVASVLVLCAVLVVRTNWHPEITVQRVLSPPPDGVRWLVDVFWIMGSFGTAVGVVLLAVVVRGWLGLRDIVASALVALVASGLLILRLGQDGGRPYIASLHGYSRGFPVLHIAVAFAVATAALPYFARAVQRFIELFLALAVLATVVASQGLPFSVLGSIAIGWGATAVVHLAFGSPLGLPSGDEVGALLETVGLAPTAVVPATFQSWGAAHYTADVEGEQRLSISLYGRDASEAQLFTKLGRFVLYRHAGPMPALTRIQQVEHESSITQLAARAGARVPEVLVASTLGPSRDAVLITTALPGWPLASLESPEISDDKLDDFFGQLMRLRSAAISHGSLSPRTISVDPDRGWLSMADFRFGVSAASGFLLDQDLAAAMATLALSVGASRVAASVARTQPAEVIAGTLAHLRRAGLDPSITFEMKGKKDLLEKLRTDTAQTAGMDVPELVEPRRMSWNQLLVAAGSLIGGWALILVLINASHSLTTIGTARWGWVVATALLCVASVLGSALSDVGSVSGTLAYGRAVGLEVSNSFTVLAAGGASVAATQIRFFQQQGYDATAAVTAGAVVNLASLVAKAALFLVAIPLAWHSFRFGKALHQGGHSDILVLLLVVVVVAGAAFIVVAAVPRWRSRVVDRVRHQLADVRTNLAHLAKRPSKVLALFGGRVAAQLFLTLALGAALHAFGAQLSLPALIIAITVAGMLASASPAGGGMGVAEAGLILALTAGGIDKEAATAAVFVQRLFSAYLPPIAGWLTFLWMRKREYL